MIHEFLPDRTINGGVFHRRIGKNQNGRIHELTRIGRRIGHQIAIAVAETGIKRAAWAILGWLRNRTGGNKQKGKGQNAQKTSDHIRHLRYVFDLG
jgi:hypothetical protein